MGGVGGGGGGRCGGGEGGGGGGGGGVKAWPLRKKNFFETFLISFPIVN